jgi:hypothetical protein
MIRRRTILSITVAAAVLTGGALHAASGRDSITPEALEQWLTYIASDELQGRGVFTEGLGLAAGYIQGHLKEWGVQPAGDGGTYLQVVRVLGVKSTSRSSVTVRVGKETRTFKDGEGVVFPKYVGAKRTFTIDRVEFAGYGLDAPGANYSDLKGKDYRDAAVVFIGQNGPKQLDADTGRRILGGRARWLTEQIRAAAAIGPSAPDRPTRNSADAETSSGRAQVRPDFTTTQRLDHQVAPAISGNDAFLQFLFSRAPVRYDDLKKRADAREPLPTFRLDDVRITFTVDADYTVVRTQLTQNIVAVIEGSDPDLKGSYVAVGAHYDHVGYAQGELDADQRRRSAPGKVSQAAPADRIWNGADDDGSGTVALMGLARAFAQGPRPKRSLLLIWHAGEESGLLGSRYYADYPTVPLDRVVAQLNIDMIGRNRDDKESESNTVYLVGSDRISSELHQLNRDANQALDQPLTLDYEMNDPADPEQVYFRSDHYSYAAKGIPIIFFTTGLHQDYHANTDEVSKILFPKLSRVAQLVYETAWRLGNLDHAPHRDFMGPRAGKGTR